MLAANAGSLRELNLSVWTAAENIESYVRAAPGLVRMDMECLHATAEQALACLRKEAHFANVRFTYMELKAADDEPAALIRS